VGVGTGTVDGCGMEEGGGAGTVGVGVGIDSGVGETTVHAIKAQTAERIKTHCRSSFLINLASNPGLVT